MIQTEFKRLKIPLGLQKFLRNIYGRKVLNLGGLQVTFRKCHELKQKQVKFLLLEGLLLDGRLKF